MKKMYIIVNSRLSKSQRIPQSSHAVAEFMGEFGQEEEVQDWLKNHKTMVCLQGDDEMIQDQLNNTWLIEGCKGYAKFHDSDIPSIPWTAIAFWPTEDEEMFSHLRLA